MRPSLAVLGCRGRFGVCVNAMARQPCWERTEMDEAATLSRLDPSFWRETLAPYARPDARRGAVDVATSAVAYLALTALMYGLVGVSTVLVVALSVPAAGFLMRTFIVFHDCAHGSFLPW